MVDQPTPGTQLSREDLEGMTPAEINAARRAGRLDTVLRRKPTTPSASEA